MEILIKASQLILSLSILIILHELGHFIPAKLFKTKVENGSEFWFAGSSYKLSENYSSTGIPNFKNDTFSI